LPFQDFAVEVNKFMLNQTSFEQRDRSDILEARIRLLEANEKVKTGEASIELLDELNEAYEAYIEARMNDEREETREDPFVRKVLSFVREHVR
jgi:hypothetical protein